MQIIPRDLRGRTFALLRTLMQGANPVKTTREKVGPQTMSVALKIEFSENG